MNEEFDWDAYYRDTRRLSPEARGVWMDCLFQMRLSPTKGRLSEPWPVFAIMFGINVRQTQRVVREIVARGVADYLEEQNGDVTIINRRMFRAWQTRQDANYRQAKSRGTIFVTEEKSNNNGDKTQSDEIVTKESDVFVTEPKKTPYYVEEEINKSKEKKQKGPRVVASRIPDPFPLTAEMSEWARVNCAGLRIEDAHDAFAEYWTNNTTKKAEKVDWMMTWRKGMKLALKWQGEAKSKSTIGKSNYVEKDYDCAKCFDMRSILIPSPEGEEIFEGAMAEIPCPNCSGPSE